MGKGLGSIQKGIIIVLGRYTITEEDREKELLKYKEIRDIAERNKWSASDVWYNLILKSLVSNVPPETKSLMEKIYSDNKIGNGKTFLRSHQVIDKLGMDIKNGSHRAIVSRAFNTLRKKGLVQSKNVCTSLTKKGWEAFRKVEEDMKFS